ncbi:MAG: hypothetical protein HXY41_16520 [Chloroflexi bacterium]|nr:hypothetical protein [Chloroflexota bacterium]
MPIRNYIQYRHESGQGLAEYALILVLVGVVVIAVLSVLGPNINLVYCQIIATLGSDLPDQCLTNDITITGSFYDPGLNRVTITATYKGGYDPNVTLTATPGGVMAQQGSGYRITFNHVCPCTINITASVGGSVEVNLS